MRYSEDSLDTKTEPPSPDHRGAPAWLAALDGEAEITVGAPDEWVVVETSSGHVE